MKKSLYWVLGAIALVAAVLIGYALGGSGKDKDAPPAPDPTTVSSVAPSTQAQAAVKIEPSGETGAFLWGPGKTIATSEDITHVHRRMANDPFAIGKVDAPVVISEFSDFECPFCAKYANETYPQVLKDYVDKGLVRVEWNDMAVNGPDAIKAAEAGRAAAAQGKFHEFHNALYTASKDIQGHPENDIEDFVRFATEAGVPDLDRFRSEVESGTYTQAVTSATKYGASIGISGTPSFIIGDQFVSGAQPYEVFQKAIEEQLQKNK
ncbi:thioredoxin domain-containing protein [Corynebacterium sp. HMSC073D01]|uniref:DsbA family protein n=1 Tax=Corynebacterium sp. HMSC073D01 TaxID=1739536 RepID=UPI0008A15A19|nr:thioredoxin domain-containing protein [Corynebacterium sp. HMSC073D01]OFO43942.1 disulfide bond formation protein DsbA [Corynebacterium sp. HMSC073D01]